MKDNQIISPLQAIIDVASKKATSGKIEAVVARHQARQQATSNRRFVLADVSGSMAEKAGGSTKIDLLRKALSDSAIDWTAHDLIAFGSYPTAISTPSDLPHPAGGTALHLALEYIAASKPVHTLLVSDGHPDDAKLAFAAADKVTGRIDVIYIGPDDDFEAIRFMYQLAGRTGGSVVVNDVRKKPRELSQHIQKLLPA